MCALQMSMHSPQVGHMQQSGGTLPIKGLAKV
jgi:hypothetical protein